MNNKKLLRALGLLVFLALVFALSKSIFPGNAHLSVVSVLPLVGSSNSFN
jgi:hypothetical protein